MKQSDLYFISIIMLLCTINLVNDPIKETFLLFLQFVTLIIYIITIFNEKHSLRNEHELKIITIKAEAIKVALLEEIKEELIKQNAKTDKDKVKHTRR